MLKKLARSEKKGSAREAGSARVPVWRSLGTKFALSYIAIIAVVLILLNTYPLLVFQDLVYQSKQATLVQGQAAVLASTLAGPETLIRKSPDDTTVHDTVEGTISTLGMSGVGRILVTDPSGLVVYDSNSAEEGNVENRYALLREITVALQDGGYDVFRSDFREGVFRSRAAVPVVYRNMVQGAVYIYERDAEQGELLLGVQKNLQGISVIICVVALAISLLFSKALTRRISALLRAVRTVREGEYSHRVASQGGDELSRLAEEFNALTGRLQTTEEVRRRFVSDASHELKTPLASIRLLTDSILQNEQIDKNTAKEFVSDIGEEAERLTRITEKLLTLTRLDGGPPPQRALVDVRKVVEKVQRMLTPLARAVDVAVEARLEKGCIVAATEDDIYQIAFNLMENAVKYNLPGGKVIVTLCHVPGGESGRVLLRVEDTGVGIPEEELSKIFDRFYRVDKARSRAAGGTGLGLSIVRDTARLHGGTVNAHRRSPEGTCFEVSFPLAEEKEGEDQ